MKILLMIVIVLVILELLVVGALFYWRSRRKLSPRVAEEIREQWKGIIRMKDFSKAVMEADKLIDYALGQMGFKGSMAQKLKMSRRLFTDPNQVYMAHKVRNNVAHQIGYQVDEKTFKKAMLAFKQALKDLQLD